MLGSFKLKTKQSLRSNRHLQPIYIVSAKIRNKNLLIPRIEVREIFVENTYVKSSSPSTPKHSPSRLFQKAKKVKQTDTFLPRTPLKKNEKKSLKYLFDPETNIANRLTTPTKLNSFERQEYVKVGIKSAKMSKKQKMIKSLKVQIVGEPTEAEDSEELMTALTRLILGKQQDDSNVQLELLECIHYQNQQEQRPNSIDPANLKKSA